MSLKASAAAKVLLSLSAVAAIILTFLAVSVMSKPMSDSWPQEVNEPYSGDVDCKDRACIWNKLLMMGLVKPTTYRQVQFFFTKVAIILVWKCQRYTKASAGATLRKNENE